VLLVQVLVNLLRNAIDKGACLGVGLAISQMIVDAHGGTIGTHQNPGRGATFTAKLPRSAPSNRQKTA